MADEHKKITIKLYQNHDFHPRVEIFGVGSIKQCNFAQRPRHGICIDIEVKRPLMGHILRKNSYNLYYLILFIGRLSHFTC